MANKSGLLQVCVTCRREVSNDGSAEGQTQSGQALYDRLSEAVCNDEVLKDSFSVEPVECMNACQSSCTVTLRSAGKFGFVIGDLDETDERVDDVLTFAKSYAESEKGSPAWRERPQHVRKNTLVRLHPSPNFSDMND